MTEQELTRLEIETIERLKHCLSMDTTQAKFVINMVASFHTTRGGALYRINDYLDERGY